MSMALDPFRVRMWSYLWTYETNTAQTVREQVHDGQTGELREMAYTSCKIVGSGSFGIVFQTKLIDTNEDAAIKRVLQDKRFKVGEADFARHCDWLIPP